MLFDEIRKREIPLILDECCFFIILILSCFEILEIKYESVTSYLAGGRKKWPLYCPQGSGTLRQQYTLIYSVTLCFTLLYSALLCFTLLYTALLCSSLLYSALLCSTLLYSALLCSTLLYCA